MIIRGTTAAIVVAALGVSLAANVFLGGYLVARGAREAPMPAIDRGILLGGHDYPPPIRSALKEAMRQDRDDMRERLRALRRARRESFEAMRADPFDAARLAAALAAERAAVTRLQEGGHGILERVIGAAPADERAQIERARRGDDRHKGRGGPGRHDHGGDGGPDGADDPPARPDASTPPAN